MAECLNAVWIFLRVLAVGIIGVAVLIYFFIKWALFGCDEDDEEYEEYLYEDDEDLE